VTSTWRAAPPLEWSTFTAAVPCCLQKVCSITILEENNQCKIFLISDGNLSMSPAPNKAIMNLTTAAHKVVFNPTAQILAISSKFKDSALKLVRK
jgi:hypothetical protein